MNGPRLSARSVLCLIGVLATLTCPAASANDRPFQIARTAVMEDDEHVWSFESWVQRYGTVRGLSFEPEYTFGAGTSVQVELSRFTDRSGSQTGYESEIEFKQLFNNVARDGWGWGISAALGVEHTHDDGSVRSVGLKLPLSVALGDGGGYLHLDAGITKASGSRRAWSGSAAIERELFKRTTVFSELAHEADLKFAQIGVRHWLRRDKLAIDFALQQQRNDGRRASGFILGLGWYDL